MSRLRIGILGGGQLGRMMALAGYPLDLAFSFYESTPDCPSAALGPVFGDAQNSTASLDAFIDSADIFTYEFENIPVAWVERIAAKKPLYPGVKSLAVSQNRINEKKLFAGLNIPSARFAEIRSEADLQDAVREIGLPLVVKTVTMGYDGKGQFLLRDAGQVPDCWAQLGAQAPLIAEEFVHFKRELSIIAVRGRDGSTACYPLTENVHHRGILSHSVTPAPFVDENVQLAAEHYISAILQELGHVGALTLEMFETRHGLMANETAPRVHNSGHWSIEGAPCSQFENHVRAVAGLPLGSTRCDRPVAMINIIGQHPVKDAVLRQPDAHLHLYGKSEREGRKLGHITLTASHHHELESRLRNFVEILPNPMALPVER
ncbi:MAG: 5-(carboxyamino)imidazole ribonucleotide synthase [Moraxellaceae bacterium]|jgi:5-(carboxyamino)imidazole ribonucleotide synthase|nr:5-(carboxyamino)imidazole ribonucleotide synthase [Moraxellaceae bacterium]